MHTIETIKHVVEKTNIWVKKPNGFDAQLLDGTAVPVSLEDLCLYDKRLPVVLSMWSKVLPELSNGENLVSGVMGSKIDSTLELWKNHKQLILDTQGILHAVKGLYSIGQRDSPTLLVKMMYYDVDNLRVGMSAKSNPIPVVRRFIDGLFTVDRRWMDKTYPDWEKNWEILESLDVHAFDRATFLLTPQSVVSLSTALPDNLTDLDSKTPP